ncbi:MAG: hypothetical protein WCI27_02465 [Candidatus Omnitrophota bacterium]
MKQLSIGTIIFAVLFLFMSYYASNLPVGIVLSYSSAVKERVPEIIYTSMQRRIELIEKSAITGKANLIKSGREAAFNQQFTAFKNDAENFRQKYIVQYNLLPYDKIVVFIGFLTCILYLIAGVGLFMHFLWARMVVFAGVFSSVLLYLAGLYHLCWITKYSQEMNARFNALDMQLNFSGHPVDLPMQNIVRMVFLSPGAWFCHLIVFTYVLAVCFYFSRPKVKPGFCNS